MTVKGAAELEPCGVPDLPTGMPARLRSGGCRRSQVRGSSARQAPLRQSRTPSQCYLCAPVISRSMALGSDHEPCARGRGAMRNAGRDRSLEFDAAKRTAASAGQGLRRARGHAASMSPGVIASAGQGLHFARPCDFCRFGRKLRRGVRGAFRASIRTPSIWGGCPPQDNGYFSLGHADSVDFWAIGAAR